MDSLINAAAQALAAGEPLHALKRVALRDDAPALALRGIAMAQLGDLDRASDLLKRAARAFGRGDAVARARCVIAQAEIALVTRNLAWPEKVLEAARGELERRGDRVNAAYGGCLAARRSLLIGRVDEAERRLSAIDPSALPPALRVGYELATAGIAIRRLRTRPARAALDRARGQAEVSAIPALRAEVHRLSQIITEPVARAITRGVGHILLLADVEALLASDALVIDACRNVVRCGAATVPLSTRPVLFALARALGEGWPSDVSRQDLVRRAFRARQADESHRARLRVEIGRLRAELATLADVEATEQGFALSARGAPEIVVLAPLADEDHASVLALLADGETWSSSALAIALGVSPRSVQRAIEELARAGKVRSLGKGRARRWMAPPFPDFPTTLLLPGPLPSG